MTVYIHRLDAALPDANFTPLARLRRRRSRL
jgi:hypothetical protein